MEARPHLRSLEGSVAKVAPLFAPLACVKLVQFFTVLQSEASSQRKFFELGPPASLDLALKSPAGRPPVDPPLKNRPRETPLFGPKYRVSSPNGATFFRAKIFSNATPFEIFEGLSLSFAPCTFSQPCAACSASGATGRKRAKRAPGRAGKAKFKGKKAPRGEKSPSRGAAGPPAKPSAEARLSRGGSSPSPSLQFGSGAPPQKAGLSPRAPASHPPI